MDKETRKIIAITCLKEMPTEIAWQHLTQIISNPAGKDKIQDECKVSQQKLCKKPLQH